MRQRRRQLRQWQQRRLRERQLRGRRLRERRVFMMGELDGVLLGLVLLAVVVLVPLLGSAAADRSRRRERRGKPIFPRRALRGSRQNFLGDSSLDGPACEDPGPTDLNGNGYVGCGTGGCGAGDGDW